MHRNSLHYFKSHNEYLLHTTYRRHFMCSPREIFTRHIAVLVVLFLDTFSIKHQKHQKLAVFLSCLYWAEVWRSDSWCFIVLHDIHYPFLIQKRCLSSAHFGCTWIRAAKSHLFDVLFDAYYALHRCELCAYLQPSTNTEI